jgi:hypothetical protein
MTSVRATHPAYSSLVTAFSWELGRNLRTELSFRLLSRTLFLSGLGLHVRPVLGQVHTNQIRESSVLLRV